MTRKPLISLHKAPDEVVYDPTGTLVATRSASEDTAGPWTVSNFVLGQTVATLDPNIKALAFSPDGKRLIYHYRNGITSNLSTAQPDGSNWQTVLDVPRTLGQLWWLSPVTWVIYQDSGASPTNHLVGLSSRNDKMIGAGNKDVRPSPAGEYVLLGNVGAAAALPAPELTLARVTADGLVDRTTLPYATTPDLTAWDTKGSAFYVIAPILGSPELVRFDPASKQATVLADAGQFTQRFGGQITDLGQTRLVAVDQGTLYALVAGELRAIAIAKE